MLDLIVDGVAPGGDAKWQRSDIWTPGAEEDGSYQRRKFRVNDSPPIAGGRGSGNPLHLNSTKAVQNNHIFVLFCNSN